MKKSQNYFLLAALFLTAFLVVQFTDIYGDPIWFKVFAVICGVSYLISGVSYKSKGE